MTKLIGEAATLEFAAKLAKFCQPPLNIHLQGELGSGKTTFARGFINKLGYSGNVKSPTFTLVETYDLESARLYHFDLYRLKDPLELEYIGIRDLVGEVDVMCLIEWPERGGAGLPEADLVISLEYHGESRDVDYQANSTKGQMIIDKL
ncbi:MAG: tRNA (adenosine(37)-N6)-threonylcarbamoyltransferase complex ATPase subunit type 1 TsaE [Gammaproteobacteria bacterium]|nr:MAG: tRNA (adenosine(37)-N6)-threonylcarbamoyltransferase complex ATPase subunit type 1 TsaE [Gammaproteobacteria bacterium]